jgi:hypothetical protein
MSALDILDGIQTRLDASSSDPKWLNDSLAELKAALLAGDTTAAPVPVDPAGIAAIEQFGNQVMDAAVMYRDSRERVINIAPKMARDPQSILFMIYVRELDNGELPEVAFNRAKVAAEYYLQRFPTTTLTVATSTVAPDVPVG